MFARKRTLEVITGDSRPTAPPVLASPAPEASTTGVPTLKSVSPRYGELSDRASVLRDEAERLRAELAETQDRERTTALELKISENARRLTSVYDDLRKESGAASVLICEQVAPKHRELVEAIAKAVLELHRANLAYTEFTATLDRRSVKWARLKPAFPQFVGHPRDKQSPLAGYLKQVTSDGFVERGSIPKELR